MQQEKAGGCCFSLTSSKSKKRNSVNLNGNDK